MVPSLMRYPGDLFADFDELQRQMDRLFGASGLNSSIRAVQRGSFPAVNVGTTPDAIEIYAFAPGIDAA
ncbi:MAG: Hsp20/alpha crystallin family protein, partial [Betaproteobacteria bacterium]